MLKRLLFAACVGTLAAGCAPASPPAGAPEPASSETTVSETTAPEGAGRVAAMQLRCGDQNFRVAFEETRAVLIGEDGSNTELARLTPGPNSAPGVDTYTNGVLTFAKQGGGDTATVIRFARGRMAFQDCAIAQN